MFLPGQALVSGFLSRARHARGDDNKDSAGPEAASLYCARLNNQPSESAGLPAASAVLRQITGHVKPMVVDESMMPHGESDG